MEENKKGRKLFETKTDVVVFLRSLFEFAVICVVAYMLFHLFFDPNRYVPYDKSDENIISGQDNGFICISYFGIDRTGTDTLVSTENLEKQLRVLRELGYVTITQQDVLDYYEKGTALPDKALLLLFEDGRTDTAIFSQPYLEKNNFIATMCSYGSNLETQDYKKLGSNDIRKLDKSTFWESGTNGYRLSYINVFDRYGRFLGEMDSLEYNALKPYLGREYNHYLMDYYRDENYMPVESYAEMKERISYDYTLMEKLYTKALGYVPKLYIRMHANTDRFGNNARVSEVNQINMENLFSMNFNREGFAVNKVNTDTLDLTRLQSQAYWSVNHLLMRIWDDLDGQNKDNIKFYIGDTERSSYWETELGAAEFLRDSIYLVSLPDDRGVLELLDSASYGDIELETELTGNYCGDQSIILRCGEDDDSGIKITFRLRELILSDHGQELARVNLDEVLGVHYDSVDEDSRNALVREFEVRADSARDWEESMAFRMEASNKAAEEAASVEEGAAPYIRTIEGHEPGDWKVVIRLKGDRLDVLVDGKEALTGCAVETLTPGSVKLEAKLLPEEEYRQRNITDDVYEARFSDLIIRSLADGQDSVVLYDATLHGTEKAGNFISVAFNRIIDWFVKYL